MTLTVAAGLLNPSPAFYYSHIFSNIKIDVSQKKIMAELVNSINCNIIIKKIYIKMHNNAHVFFFLMENETIVM